jgi:Outer membrane protein beta-barrel domain
MKKIILSLLSVAAITSAANAQIAFAPELGLNLANMAINDEGTKVSTSMKAGLTVGAIVDIGFTDNLYLQPGLFYMMNGAKFSGGSYNVNTIQIPVNVEYKLGDPGDNRFFFGAGPYLGYNVSANTKVGSTNTKIDIGTDKTKDGLKPLDIGLGVNLGYLLSNGFFARAHYQLGLTDLNPVGKSDHSIKTSGLGLTVGYYLGGKKAKKPAGKK